MHKVQRAYIYPNISKCSYCKTIQQIATACILSSACSERADSTGATGARLQEGAAINKSLSTLGNVIKGKVTINFTINFSSSVAI